MFVLNYLSNFLFKPNTNMYIKDQDNFMICIQHALNLPIRQRCIEFALLFERGSLLELHNFFPVLIENIFGPQGTMSWGLRSVTETACDDYNQLRIFLGPTGPVFNLIYTLLKDPGTKYDFPLTYLPLRIRQFLENAQQHPFYADLLHVNPQTKQVMSLLLNPFDYYVFHFAYHLINPWHQRSGSAVTTWNTVYYKLCCDYVIHFLPTSPDAHVLPEIHYYGKNTVNLNQQSASSVSPLSTLLNKEMTNKSLDESAFHKNLDRNPRSEIWRSETVLTVFTDMWLHNDQISHSNDINNSFNTSAAVRMLHYNELPTGEYMRIIRVLIKQLHSFSASAKADDTYLCELKKIATPMIQGKFYIFLRNLIHRWPLDGSFRLVLELWLTYIQPWRYPPDNLIKTTKKNLTNPDVDDIALSQTPLVEREFLPFIAENLLAYIIIFQQLLPRFCRVDLVSPKMSLMLYRITKVFDQPNLPNFLREIEHCVENNHSPTHKYHSHWSWNLPPLSPTSNWSSNSSSSTNIGMLKRNFSSTLNTSTSNSSFLNNPGSEKKWSVLVRQKIFELEGPNFCYKPLFTNPPASEVYDIIYQIKRSITFAQELVQMKQKEEAELYKSFWSLVKSFFQTSSSNDEFTLNERLKVPAYLEVSLQNLMDIFQISEVSNSRAGYDSNNFNQNISNVSSTSGPNGFEMTSDLKFLTPERVRNRIKQIRYDGDPDLHPIRSNEVTFLVRVLYQFALKINQEYGPQFYRLYYDPSFSGRLARQILCPPITVYKYDKTVEGSPRVATNLPPRISLRYLSTYKFLFYLFIGAIVALLCGSNIITYLLFIIVIFILYKCIRAIPNRETPVRHNYPTEGFGNISFNDSF